MPKTIHYKDSNEYLKARVQKMYSYNLREAAEMIGVSHGLLRYELSRKKTDPKPGWLLEALGLERVTHLEESAK